MGSSSSKSDEEKQELVRKQLEEEMAKKSAESARICQSVEKSLAKDQSYTNQLSQFSTLLELEGVNVNQIGGIVLNAKRQWTIVCDGVDKLKDKIGSKNVNKVKSLNLEYFGLLVETGAVIEELSEASRIQQYNVAAMLGQVRQMEKKENDLLKIHESMQFKGCMNTLSNWVDDGGKLENIVQEWQKIAQELQTAQTAIQKRCEKLESMSTGWKITGALAVLAVVGVSVAALAVATGGAGAAAAIAGGAKTVTMFGSKVVVSHLIAASIGAAAGSLAVGAITYGIAYANSDKKKVDTIVKKLQAMMKQSCNMKMKIKDLDSITNKIKTNVKNENVAIMKFSLLSIQKYLMEYSKQSEDVQKLIRKECLKFCK